MSSSGLQVACPARPISSARGLGRALPPAVARHHRPATRPRPANHLHPRPPAAADGSAAAGDGQPSPSSSSSTPSTSLPSRLKAWLSRDKVDRDAMKRLGLGAVASYGFVSNLTYGTGLAISWIGFVKQKGVSPLAPGQWAAFLAFYAGFWMAQNFVRPLRLSAALAMAPLFDRFISLVERRVGLSRSGAFGVYLGVLGVTTCVIVFGSIFLACGPGAYARV